MKAKPPAKQKKTREQTHYLGKVRRALALVGKHRVLIDNCVQDVQGLLLRFHVVSQAIPRRSRAAKLMEETLDRADEVLAEVRDQAKSLARWLA